MAKETLTKLFGTHRKPESRSFSVLNAIPMAREGRERAKYGLSLESRTSGFERFGDLRSAHPRDWRRDDGRHRSSGRAAGARLGPARVDHGSARRLGSQSGGVARLVWRRASISSPASAPLTSKARQRASRRSASHRISSAIQPMRPGG